MAGLDTASRSYLLSCSDALGNGRSSGWAIPASPRVAFDTSKAIIPARKIPWSLCTLSSVVSYFKMDSTADFSPYRQDGKLVGIVPYEYYMILKFSVRLCLCRNRGFTACWAGHHRRTCWLVTPRLHRTPAHQHHSPWSRVHLRMRQDCQPHHLPEIRRLVHPIPSQHQGNPLSLQCRL